MSAIWRKIISVIVVVMLAVTLFPPLGEEAQASSFGLHLDGHFSEDTNINPTGVSLTINKPFETNQSSITISGSTVGIDPVTISYRVFKYGTTQVRDEQISPAVNGDEFTFDNIVLFPGLNEIELYYQTGSGSGSISKINRYVYFLNAPSISNLEVIDAPNVRVEDFSPDAADFANSHATFNRVMRVTTNPIMIQGNVANANEVTLEGQTAAIFGNRFIVDTSLAGIIKGDYNVSFTVRNESASVNYPHNIAFSNGEPLVLDIRAETEDVDGKLSQLHSTTLSGNFTDDNDNPTDDFTFSGYIYIDNNATFGRMDVRLQYVGDAMTTQATKSITLTELEANYPKLVGDNYTVYQLNHIALDPIDVNFDITTSPGQYQLVFDTYDHEDPNVGVRYFNAQTYKFNYVNENMPYIKSVTQDGLPLQTNAIISRIGQNIVVEVGGTTKSVTLTSTLLATTYEPASVKTVNLAPGETKATFTLTKLIPGSQTFTITVSDGDTPPIEVSEDYFVEAVLTPTVKLTGLSNDQPFDTNNIPRITVEYVNLTDVNARAMTEIYLNGGPVDQNAPGNFYTISKVDGSACDNGNDRIECLKADQFGLTLTSTAILPGRNELRFRFTNNMVVSEKVVVFYYLATDSPFVDVKPEPAAEFDEGDTDNSYTTTAGVVDFKGTLANGKHLLIKQNGDLIAHYVRDEVTDIWSALPGSGSKNVKFDAVEAGTFSFEIENLSLILENVDGTLDFNATSTFVFEVYKIDVNTAPLSVNTVTISRSPAAYDMVDLTKSFFEKGVINRNYLPFTIDTDGAIAVTVNKIEMDKIDQPVSGSNRIRYHLDVPLKPGVNKLNIELIYPGATVKDTLEILSSTINQPGAAQKDELGRKVRFRMFNNELDLTFPRGTVIRQAAPAHDPAGPISQLYNDVPLFFGIANPTTGLVLEENKDQLGFIYQLSANLRVPNQYAYASHLYWIDAGMMEVDGSVKGGVAPFTESGDTYINFRYLRPNQKLEPSAPDATTRGTLTIKYDPNLRLAARQLLTVMYHDGRQWHNLGGKVNSKNGTITVPFRDFGYYAVMRLDKTFIDVIRHDWARDDIEILKARGWMRELSPTLFGTGTFATRGELATILVKALELDLSYEGEMTFADVPQFAADSYDRWDYRYIETAARAGIVRGGEHNLFRPDDTITREETAVMLARAMNLTLSSDASAKQKMDRKFLDGTNINTYAYSSIEAIEKKGIMLGQPGPAPNTLLFAPKARLTRAELATITVRVLRDLKRLE